MNWFYIDGGEQAGPVTDESLAELRRVGRVTDDTPVWHEGMADWVPLHGALPVPAVAAVAQGVEPPFVVDAKPGAVCSECGRSFSTEDMIRHGDAYVCASCKPVFIQKLSEGVHADGALPYAGFWVRFAAKFVDGLILGIPFLVLYFLAIYQLVRTQRPEEVSAVLWLAQLAFMPVQMIYSIVFVGRYGATPGKMLCKLRVVTPDGGRVSYGRATGRFFAELISGMVCYIGYLMVAFDSQKRGLHDHICSTRVIQTRV